MDKRYLISWWASTILSVIALIFAITNVIL